MERILTLLRLYSVRVVAVLAVVNSALAVIPDVPGWLMITVNVVGAIAHAIVREVPQPEVTAKLQKMRVERLRNN